MIDCNANSHLLGAMKFMSLQLSVRKGKARCNVLKKEDARVLPFRT